MTMLPQAWTPLRYHEQQTAMWRTKARFVAAACGRGSGKSELAKRRVVRFLPVKKPWHDPKYFYALPTRQQAMRVAWDSIISLIPKEWIAGEPNKSEMRINTIFGSQLWIVGMDKPARIEGVQWDGGVIDESCDQKPKAFDLSVLPALSHRDAWCWRIGVPKRFGVGANEFKEFFDRGLKGDPDIESYCWPSSSVLSPEKLRWAQENLDALDFEEQYGATWQNAGGGIFHAFSDDNVSDQVKYDPTRTFNVCSDFNVNPMSWCYCQEWTAPDGVVEAHFFDELFVRNCNTQMALNILALKYGVSHLGRWKFFGDASGQARDTSASLSDYLQIKNDDRFTPKEVVYPPSNPSRVNRFASCNAMLCNAKGRRRVKIHPRCRMLIADLKARAYVEGTREPDDSGDIGHMSDAFGYYIHRKFPIRLKDSGGTHKVIIGDGKN